MKRWLIIIDTLALVGIVQGLWGVDIAVFAPLLMLPGVHWGLYLALMYVQIGAAGTYLYLRLQTSSHSS